jgi:hypothetical protein
VVVFGMIAVLAAVRGQREQRRSSATVVLPDDRSRAIRHIREIMRQRLDQSMSGLVRAELTLESVRDAVAPPTRTYVGIPGETWEPDHSSAVLDAFDRFDESLLILGEPGAGKTTMLLELASALLDRAGDNGPLPVLIELGTWRPGTRRTADTSEELSAAADAFHTWLLGGTCGFLESCPHIKETPWLSSSPVPSGRCHSNLNCSENVGVIGLLC